MFLKQKIQFLEQKGTSLRYLNAAKEIYARMVCETVPKLHMEFEAEVCCICLDSSDERIWWKHKECFHFFHFDCIFEYVSHESCNGRCPVCYNAW